MALALFAPKRPSVAVYALAGSAAFTSALSRLGVAFDMNLWMLIDIAVIATIEAGAVKAKERAVCFLMVPCWVFYQLHENGVTWALPAVNLIVASQFLLIVPWDRLAQLTRTESMA